MSKKQRRNYTPEFRLEAVKLITEQGYSYPEAAERLGVPFHSLKKDACRGKSSSRFRPVSRSRRAQTAA